MQIVPASYRIEDPLSTVDGMDVLRKIELAGRTCYKSEGFCVLDWDKERTKKFIQNLITRGHESVLEHEKMTVRFVCDRGVSHEIVRHRIASFSQESTRYCNYAKDKFGNEITVIRPPGMSQPEHWNWTNAILACEEAYMRLIELGCKPEIARSILPNSLKTEIVVTANMREWRHIFKLRTAPAAHPQMRELMIPLLAECKTRFPVLFEDINAS